MNGTYDSREMAGITHFPAPWRDASGDPGSPEKASIEDANGVELVWSCGCCGSPIIKPGVRALIVKAVNAYLEAHPDEAHAPDPTRKEATP